MRNLVYVVLALFMSTSFLVAQTEGARKSLSKAEEPVVEVAKEINKAAAIYNKAAAEIRASDYAKAMPLYEEAIRLANLNPTDSTNMKTLRLANKNGAKAAYKVATELYKEQKYQEMLILANRGVEMDDDFFPNYINKGKALDKLGKSKESITAYLDAAKFSVVAKQPADKVASLYRKGFYSLYKEKDFDAILERVKSYPGALEVADINYYTAKAYDAKGDQEKAIKYAAKAGELGEDKAVGKYYFYLGELNKAATKVGDAIKAYKKVPESSSDYARAQYNVQRLSN